MAINNTDLSYGKQTIEIQMSNGWLALLIGPYALRHLNIITNVVHAPKYILKIAIKIASYGIFSECRCPICRRRTYFHLL